LRLTSTSDPQLTITHTPGADSLTVAVDGNGLTTFTTVDGGGTAGHIVLSPDGNVGIKVTAPAELLEVEDGTSITGIQISNSAADGDPVLAFALSGTKTFTMGIDDGDGDKFKIGTSAIGTSTRFTIYKCGI